MESMNTSHTVSLETLIHAAGMTCFAEDLDRIVLRPRQGRVSEPFIAATEVVPPFSE